MMVCDIKWSDIPDKICGLDKSLIFLILFLLIIFLPVGGMFAYYLIDKYNSSITWFINN